MRKWTVLCGAVIVVGYLAAPTQAQEPIKLPATVIQSSEPMPTAPRSGGLFGRLRARREGVMTPMNQPVVQAQAVETPGKVQQAQAVVPAETPGTVQQAQATQPAPMATPVQGPVLPERRVGLLARLRERRGF